MGFLPRTDLALEERESRGSADLEGVRFLERDISGYRVSEVIIENEIGSQALCKPAGRYITIELDRLIRREDSAFEDGARALASLLSDLLPENGPVLIAGLGNPAITPDAVGHIAAKNALVTLHLIDAPGGVFSDLRSVACVEPGVLGTTGVESVEVVRAVAEKIRPAAVIAVDALASRRVERLCRTVQITDTGIIPGSGVGNARKELSANTLGVPVIAVGVPTVVDAATLAASLAEDCGARLDEDRLRSAVGGLIVTPRDIDSKVADISKLVGYGIDLALQPSLSVSDLDMLI
ncbi:MAG: GPR endopeptidase [Oscillospiraceae bacterium]|nr:GPR endopeptidase [Oscillospiraceae bacterium]